MGVRSWFRGRRDRAHERWAHAREIVVARALPDWQKGRELPRPHDYRTFAQEGYRENVIINACIREKATSVAEAKLKIGEMVGDEVEPVSSSSPVALLLENPNPEQTSFEFLETLITHLDYSGNAYVHKLRSKGGVVLQLWMLAPDRMTIVPGEDGLVKEYKWSPVGGGKDEVIHADDVIHIKYPDPLDDYYGLSPIVPVARWADVDNSSADYLRAFFTNGATPKQIIITKIGTTPKERDRVKELWREQYGGVEGWHSVGVIDADIEVKSVGTKPDELELGSVFSQTETRLCTAFGVPPILIGVLIGLIRSTFANYKEARKSFWQETLAPLYVRIGTALQRGLRPDFGLTLVISFDLSGVQALQEDAAEVRKYGLEAWTAGVATKNEARAMGNLPPLIAEFGDVFREQLPTVVEVPAQLETQARKPAEFRKPRRSIPAGPEASSQVVGDDGEDDGEMKGRRLGSSERMTDEGSEGSEESEAEATADTTE